MPTMPDLLAPECLHCRTRLDVLERTVGEHAARLAGLERLAESNARIEKLLERVLEFVTPGKK